MLGDGLLDRLRVCRAAAAVVDDPRTMLPAYANPSAISAEVAAPSPSKMRTGMSRTFQATPDTPMPLLPTAPMVPATCVPWP